MTTPHSTAAQTQHLAFYAAGAAGGIRAEAVTLVTERWWPVHQRLERGALGLADERFDERLDVVHAVLHGGRQHPPQEAGVEQRAGPANTAANPGYT